METASEIYTMYARDWLPLVFLIGLAVVSFVIRDRWAALWTYVCSFRGSILAVGVEAWRPFLRVIVPYWIWMVSYGVPVTIVDVILGSK